MVELEFPRRGVHRLASAHLATLFPLGLFRKGMRQRLDREFMVFPNLISGQHSVRRSASVIGDTQDSRAGWGHDLHSLRVLRPGDDPRRIHWKQTARTGSLIFMEREAEKSRRNRTSFACWPSRRTRSTRGAGNGASIPLAFRFRRR